MGQILSKKYNRPFVIYVHGTEITKPIYDSDLKLLFIHESLKNANVISVNTYLKRIIEKFNENNRIYVLAPGIEVIDDYNNNLKYEIRNLSNYLLYNEEDKPEELYPICNGNPPDLIVYLDDLYWRSAGTIGHGTLYLPENDLGPDDAVHDYDGIFILYDPEKEIGERIDLSIYDVAPTILNVMGLPIPSSMEGKALEVTS